MNIILLLIVALYLVCIPLLFMYGKITPANFVTFLAVIPLGIVAIFQERLKDWLSAPKLEIEFALDEPYCLKTAVTTTEDALEEDASGVVHSWKTNKTVMQYAAYYFRFRVKNIGKTQAKNCECVTEKFQEFRGRRFVIEKTFQSVNLSWSNAKSESEFLNINPNCPGWFCGIGFITEKDRGIFQIAYKPPFPNSQIIDIPNNGLPYKLRVAVYCENAKPISREFEITWTGNWNHNKDKMFKEITIK